jgi:hypothetical protein
MRRPRPSIARNLSFAVIAATGTPARDISARIVSPRSIAGSFIMISRPVSRSSAKLPEMPCTEGGVPVTIDMLLGFVKVGIAAAAIVQNPCWRHAAIVGTTPAASPASR